MKPECENNWEDYIKDWFDSSWKWCKEHWKLFVTVVIVIAAIACLFIPGVYALVASLACCKLLFAMAWSALTYARTCGLLGGAMSVIAGNSFWEGFESGAFYGAIAGLFSGGMAFVFTGGVTSVSLTLGQTLLTGAISGGGSSLVGDLGDKFFRGDDISWEQMLLNTVFAATLAAAFAGVFYGISKGFAALKLKLSNGKANLPEVVGTVDDAIEGAGNFTKLSKNDLKHVLNRHSYNNVKKEIDYMLKKYPKEYVEEYLERGFFNKNWSNEKISESVEQAYNALIKEGKRAGEYTLNIDGEDITIILSGEGKFETAWGKYIYNLKDFGF